MKKKEDDENLNKDGVRESLFPPKNGKGDVQMKSAMLSSMRLKVCVLMMIGFACALALKTNLGMAAMCMVKPSEESHSLANSTIEIPADACPAVSIQKKVAIGDLPWTDSMTTMLVAIVYWGCIPTSLLAGSLADKFGPKLMLFFSILVAVLGTLLTPPAAYLSYNLLVAIRFLIGSSEGVMLPAMNSLAARWFPNNEKSTMAAIYTSGLQISSGLTSFITAEICEAGWGWPAIFYIFGASGFIWCIVWFVFLSDRPMDNKYVSQSELEYLSHALHSKRPPPTSIPWKAIFTSPPVYANIFVAFSFMFCIAIMQALLPFYFSHELRLPPSSNGLYIMLPFTTQLITKNVIAVGVDHLKKTGRLAHSLSVKITQSVSSFGSAIAFFGLALVPTCHTPELALPFLFLFGTVFSAAICGYFTSTMSLSPHLAGTLTSINHLVANLSALLATQFYQILNYLEIRQKWLIMFLACAALQTMSGAFFVVFGSAEEQEWAKECKKQDTARLSARNGADAQPVETPEEEDLDVLGSNLGLA